MAVGRTGIIYSAKQTRPKKEKNFFKWLGLILELIGKPVYYGLLLILYGLLLLAGLTSRIFVFISKIRPPKIKIPKIVLPKIAIPRPRITKKLAVCIFALFLLIVIGFLGYWFILKDLPNPDKLITREQIISTKIYDRHGKLLYKIYRNQNRTLVKLEEIPLSLRQATIAIEDREFYRHPGLSWRGIIRAFYRNIFQGRLTGGSTITQQLVKNTLLTPEKTLRRKIKEIVLALWVEARFSKDEILQMYLNEVGYGGAAYGIEEASQLYFGKHVHELSLGEATLLAGLPASPTTYSPFGAHPELAKRRQKEVIRRMVEDRYLTPEKAQEVIDQDIHLAPQKTDIYAPHFVMYVKDLLVKKYGERAVEEGGLEVTTSLDLDIQNMAQTAVLAEIKNIASLRVTNGAALVTNPKTGEILAMVGSRNYFDQNIDGNFNVTTANRQPGSSIKPINYSVALSMGFTPATIIPDTPITYKVPGQPPYSPKNYDNRFHGNVPLRIALASSYNVPAVKVLSAIGVSRMIEQGQKMGITTWNDPSQYGLSLTLGGGEVKMVDMAVAYGTLANLGIKVDLQPILEVKDYKGKVLESFKCQGGERTDFDQSWDQACDGEPVLNPQIAYILTDILSDNLARTPAFGPNSVLVISDHPHVAVKTGTSNNLKDNWTIGYISNLLVATWVGNNDATPMAYVASGITGASPIWHNIMTELVKDKPDDQFTLPENLVKVEICTLTGTLACDACPSKKTEIFLPGTEPKKSCNEEEIKKILEEKKQDLSR